MEGKLNIGRLSKTELIYQLKIRGVTHDATVEIMRSTLRGLMKIEKSSSFIAPTYPFTFAEDRLAIEAGLAEIEELLNDCGETWSSSEYAKITTKIAHYVIRTNRCNPGTNDEKNVRSKLLVKLVTLSSQLDATTRVRLVNSPDTLQPDNDDADDNISDTLANVPANLVKSIPVSKWNLTYSGNNQIISLSAFLERVDEMRIARNVSYEVLFISALDLFTDKALIWYRANRKSFRNWKELVDGLREEFLPVNYDDQLLEEVKRRTQGKDETIGLYLSVMSNLFTRFTVKLTKAQELKILLRNILPFYQSQLGLVEITSVAQLQKLGRRLEACRVSVETFAPPPSKHRALEPDLAYAHVMTNLAELDVNSSESAVAHVNNNNQSRVNSQKCWNCGRIGHRSSQCRQPRTKHCFRCGHPQVTVANCPSCSKNSRPAH